MGTKIGEVSKTTVAFNYAAILASASGNSTYYSMTNYDRILFAVSTASIQTGAVVAVEARQSINSSALGSISMASVVTNGAIIAANTATTIEVRASQLNTTNGYYYVGIRIYETNLNTANVYAVAIQHPARWPQASMLS